MKIVILVFILGLGLSFGVYADFPASITQSRPCSYRGRSYSEGERINIRGIPYECRSGRWVRASLERDNIDISIQELT